MKAVKSLIINLIIIVFSLLFTYCQKNNQSNQQNNNNAIPVRVEEIKYKSFEKYLTFFSKLSGIKEATKGSNIGGKIKKINFKVGDYVKERDIVVEFDTYTPAVQYEQAKTAYENLKKNYERMKKLLQAGETSQANFEAIETQYLVAKRNYEAAKQVLFIDAPFDGIIVDIKVNVGDVVDNEIPLFTVAQINKMRSKIWVSEKEVNQFKKGMKVITEYNGEKFVGKVVEISMAVDPSKQAFFVQVEFDNPHRILKSGVVVELKVLIYKNPNAVIIPRNLVNKDDKGNYVFVINNNKAEKRYITIGMETGLDYEILGGLNPGDFIVTKGFAQLDEDTFVNIIQ